MIRIENLIKQFKKNKAVNNLSLHVRKQEIYGFLGPNGAGKTTTIKILSTLTLPTSGMVFIDKCNVLDNPLQAKKQIGVVHQTLNLDPELTGYENLLIHGLLFNMKIKDIKKNAAEFFEFVELKDVMGNVVKTYSGGMRRRLTIARALIHHPKVLIMDEPTAGLDAFARRKVWGLMKRIRDNGSTIFLTTHYIEEAQYLSDRVGILDKGGLIAEGSPEKLINNFGKIAVDMEGSEGLEVEFFQNRAEAVKFVSRIDKSATIRGANLEDVFIKLTGRRVK
ncbi:MAG: ABC transporter ATP-binding protein [Candidatus Omnitrophica bacterium]|nr:ABC transporter ATP-binding protein [Candidatus Omnitrophota bacterium]